jgi:hypothetical protein
MKIFLTYIFKAILVFFFNKKIYIQIIFDCLCYYFHKLKYTYIIPYNILQMNILVHLLYRYTILIIKS